MGRTLDDRFLRILKIFKWGRDAEKALEVLRVKVDPTLVRHVLSDPDTHIDIKLNFFKWASTRHHFHHDPSAYMSLIRSLHASRMFSEMWTTTLSMLRHTPSLHPQHFSHLVNLLTQCHMVNQALIIFRNTVDSAPSPTAHLNSILSALLSSGHPQKVVQLYSEISSEPFPANPDTITYTLLLSSYQKLGPARADSAIRLFQEMKDNRLQPNARIYTAMIRIFFDSGEAGRAMTLLEEMSVKGVGPTVFTYTEVVRGLGSAGREGEAYEIFTTAVNNGVIKPDVVLLNSVLAVLARAGRAEEAVRVFDSMVRVFGVRRTAATYNTMIKAAFEHGKGKGVREWMRMMEREEVAGNGHTFSILVDGFCKTNRVERAVRMIEEREEEGVVVPPETYCSVIGALGRCGRWEVAEELFREVVAGAGPGVRVSSRVYAVMIKHLGRRGRVEEAVRLFGEVREEGAADVYAYNAVMAGLVRGGEVEAAVCMMERMAEESGCLPDLNTYNIILNGFARCGGPRRAVDMLRRMKESDVKPDVVSYNTVLGCLSRAGMLEEAAGLMKEMREVGVEYDRVTYSSILEAVGRVDEPRCMLY